MLWRRANQEYVVVKIRRRHWEMSGIMSKGKEDFARETLEWNPAGSRGLEGLEINQMEP